ncbi:hypothetical protein AB0425_42245, partial [Actinosynnema sp. NPDC051121]
MSFTGLSFTGASPRAWMSAARCRAGSAGPGGTGAPPNQVEFRRGGDAGVAGGVAAGGSTVRPWNGDHPSSFSGTTGGRTGCGP